MDLIQWLSDNALSVLTLFLTPFLAYLFSKRKEKADIEKTNAEADSLAVKSSGEAIAYWKDIANNLEERIIRLENCEREKDELLSKLDKVLNDNIKLREINKKMVDIVNHIIENVSGDNPELINYIRGKLKEIDELY